MAQSDIVLKLQRQLKEAEEERNKAAQYGLKLLESQSDLQNQLEDQRNEMTLVIENLEQEKYSLSREVELKNQILESLTVECENIKQQQKVCLEQLQEQMERTHNREVCGLKDKMEKLKAELDEARLSEKQLHQKLGHQAEMLANKSEELRMMSERGHETMSSEMLTIQVEMHELESAKAHLQEELTELQYKTEQLILANENRSRQVERLQVEKEEREKEAVNYFKALEKSHEEKRELQVQLDQALQQAQDPNSKGNSLFAEVEDHRAEMERQLISMKVQYESLQKQHSFSRQQMHRMKVQIATLLQLKGSQMDPDQMERLQSMVEQKNSEMEKLLVKVRQLEKSQQNCENTANINTQVVLQNDVYYVDLLKMKLEQCSKEMEKSKDELSLQRMKALAESQRVLELERKLFTNDRHLKLSKSENMKLRVGLDELKMKYEPDEMIKLRTQKRRREQLPADDIPKTTDSLNCDLPSTTDIPPDTNQEKENATLSMQTDACPIPQSLCVNQDAASVSTSPDKSTSVPQRRRVRIVEDSKCIQAVSETDGTLISQARSASEESRFEPTKAEEKDFRKCERKSRHTATPILHVSSKPGAATQCPQQ
ncbi:protein Spindly isoform X2 [Rana temporaria]|uniref:protein Spindly isoform X2 n=1 Tax=Rana temporaria TaxID=8407 RepID=UPI001AACA29D|nr:protein Spindly isoform X2 [Rana temporaria]